MAKQGHVQSVGEDTAHVSFSFKDSLPSLDILCSDQFDSEDVQEAVALRAEADFYRGGQVQWLNFYWAETKMASDGTPALPFVERKAYSPTLELIKMKLESHQTVSSVNLYHKPGSGGSTLARHVMWDLRKTLRCAVLEDMTATPQDIAKQTIVLFKAGGAEKRKTVLLLVDNMPEKEPLHNILANAVAEEDLNTDIPVVIILNCVRIFQEKLLETNELLAFVKNTLSVDEKIKFKIKWTEIQKCYPEVSKDFHGFKIIASNFSQVYVHENIIKTLLDDVDIKARNTQLFSYLALWNAYLPGSSLLKSDCEKFLGPPDTIYGGPPFEERMQPFTKLLITFSRRENLIKRDFVRVAHPLLATLCCEKLCQIQGLALNTIAKNFLQTFVSEETNTAFSHSMNHLLVKRQEDLFSPLIMDMKKTEDGLHHCVHLLKLASKKFPKDALVPQALARLLSLMQFKHSQAVNWAEEAISRSPNNSYVADTLGQVHKHALKKLRDPNLVKELEMAQKAVVAFKYQQEVAEKENKTAEECGRKDKIFNNRGLFGHIQVANIVFDLLPSDVSSVLRGECEIESLDDRADYYPFKAFLIGLKADVQRIFEFFQNCLTYSKPKAWKDDPSYLYCDVTECFLKYETSESVIQTVNEKKTVLSFPGLLHCLFEAGSGEENKTFWEQIVAHYCELRDKDEESLHSLNHLLANVCLSFWGSESPYLMTFDDLKSSLCRLVRASETSATPEVFFLSMLIFWPLEQDGAEESPHTGVNIVELVTQLEKSYDAHYERYLHGRYIVPLFFLTQGTEWKRLAPRSKIPLQPRNEGVWKNTEVQDLLKRVSGKIEKRKVFAYCGDFKIPVSPDNKASVCKPGKVSFYLGFSIKGPVAFDIKYDS